MLDALGRKQRAKKASEKAAKLLTARAKPFIDGVVAAYGFLRIGKPVKAGRQFLTSLLMYSAVGVIAAVLLGKV